MPGQANVYLLFSLYDLIAHLDLVSSSDIDNLKPDGMECTKFIALCKQALTKQDIEKRKFSYSISMMRDDGSVIKVPSQYLMQYILLIS